MRGLGDPDVMLSGDLGVRQAVTALGGEGTQKAVARRGLAWAPWRSYAVGHLWASLGPAAAHSRTTLGHEDSSAHPTAAPRDRRPVAHQRSGSQRTRRLGARDPGAVTV